ncbi:MAG: hypothetical protein EBT98_11795, partial [Opitutaceae bacterium]|nr:hypothetical protein [Opitutaceae bacterium]
SMNSLRLPRSALLAGGLALGLFEAIEATTRVAARNLKKTGLLGTRQPVGSTLQPGAKTPLWNELVKQTLPWVGKRGSKARLARFLGLPRQRLQDCLKSQRACLDAERTLRLLCWVAARQQGRDLII